MDKESFMSKSIFFWIGITISAGICAYFNLRGVFAGFVLIVGAFVIAKILSRFFYSDTFASWLK